MSAAAGSTAAFRVGLTGGLASGKSTVAGWLRDAGFRVIDADRLVAELYRPGGAGAAAAHRLFGDSVLTSEGGVDHAALAARVFSDLAARRALEQAIHPLVRRRFEELAAAAAAEQRPAQPTLPADPPQPDLPAASPTVPPSPAALPAPPNLPTPSTPPVIVLEATLLVEAGYGPGFDLIVTLEGDPELRLRRAVARGLDEAAAHARLAAQGDGARRRQGAHRVIVNDGTLADLRRPVDALIAAVRRAAASKAAPPPEPQSTPPPPAPPATPPPPNPASRR